MNNIVRQRVTSEHILQHIFLLPDDVIRVIQEYIPARIIQFTNKISYVAYHLQLRNVIYNYESYVREVVKRDYSFIFAQIIRENIEKWNNIKKYLYKNVIYASYIYFILNYCLEHNSQKCITVLSSFLKQHGLCQNQHKKNITKHIRWKN
jgi:phosphoribosyl-ATP pyrophosphohydrolase